MGSCHSSAKVACAESPWLEYADDDGDLYWYNYVTGNYTRQPQHCDWYQDNSMWFNTRTQEMRYTAPVSQGGPDAMIVAELERISSIVDASLPTATAVPVERTL